MELIDPAVKGTLNVLQSCKNSKTVKRVIITSSSAAIRFRADIEPEQLLDESSWSSLEICEQFKVNKGKIKILTKWAKVKVKCLMQINLFIYLKMYNIFI